MARSAQPGAPSFKVSLFRPQTLLQFFHAKGEGLSVDDMKSGDYKVRPLSPQPPPGPSASRLSSLTVCCRRCWMRSSGSINAPPSS